MGGTNTTTSTQTTGSASPAVQANVDKLVGNVGALSDQDFPVFDQSVYPGMTPESRGLINQGLSGPMSQAASGQYLQEGGNPYFEGLLDRSLDNTGTQVNSFFSNAGRLGSNEHVNQLTRSLADAEIGARYGQFNDEWGRMQGALGQQLGLSGMLDADALATRQGEQDLFLRQNRAPYDQLGTLSSILAGTAPAAGTQTTSTQPATPWWQTALGAGLGLASFL